MTLPPLTKAEREAMVETAKEVLAGDEMYHSFNGEIGLGESRARNILRYEATLRELEAEIAQHHKRRDDSQHRRRDIERLEAENVQLRRERESRESSAALGADNFAKLQAGVPGDLLKAAQYALEWAAKFPVGGDAAIAGHVYDLLHPLVDSVAGKYRAQSLGEIPAAKSAPFYMIEQRTCDEYHKFGSVRFGKWLIVPFRPTLPWRSFTDDAAKATRFASREEAERVMRIELSGDDPTGYVQRYNAFVSEHLWMEQSHPHGTAEEAPMLERDAIPAATASTGNGANNCICFAAEGEGHLPHCVVVNMRASDANACTCPKNGHGHAAWCRFSGQTASAAQTLPIPAIDYLNRNIRTLELANAVARHLGLNPADEIPFEELTRRLTPASSSVSPDTERTMFNAAREGYLRGLDGRRDDGFEMAMACAEAFAREYCDARKS